jgi:rhamnopyranosyl-N-acetylglucosaminyl-diphospho-decaprenol beta-1,3/1,4-galactofuranosyltransferase
MASGSHAIAPDGIAIRPRSAPAQGLTTATVAPDGVIAVIVTHNRRELLLKCVDAIESQSHPVEEIVLVDNASADGTVDMIRERHPLVTLYELDCNIGGAGGFAFGIAAARPHAGLIWLMDDDAAPRPDALEHLTAARRRYLGPPPVVVASRVVSRDDRPIPMNSPRPRTFTSRTERAAAVAVGCVPIRSASFVSVLVDGHAARRHELPVADYFIWNDDFEYTARLLRDGVGLLCPASVTEHAAVPSADPGWKFRYEVRNKIWLMTRSPALAPMERVLYAGATLRRWLVTIARSGNRRVLVRGLVEGVLRAVRRGPRPTSEVLASVHERTAP